MNYDAAILGSILDELKKQTALLEVLAARPIPGVEPPKLPCQECGKPNSVKPPYKRCYECGQSAKAAYADCPKCGKPKSVDLAKYENCYNCPNADAALPHQAAAPPQHPYPNPAPVGERPF